MASRHAPETWEAREAPVFEFTDEELDLFTKDDWLDFLADVDFTDVYANEFFFLSVSLDCLLVVCKIFLINLRI